MAAALVQTQTNSNSSQTASLDTTFGSSTVTGNLLLAFIAVQKAEGSVSTVTDNKGNTYGRVLSDNNGAGTRCDMELWWAYNVAGGASHTVTVTPTAASKIAVILREYSGLTVSEPPDKTETADGNSADLDSGSTLTTTQADELVIGIGAADDETLLWTVGTGYGNLTNVGSSGAGGDVAVAAEDKIVAATGTYNATFTLSGSETWQCGVATFKVAAAPVAVDLQSNVYFFE